MTLIDRGALTCPKLADYFLQAVKPRDRFLVGTEVEKLGVDAVTGAPIPYEGAGASVRGVLEHLHARRGGDAIFEGDHLIGLDGPWGTISLEPGGQVEWSSRPADRLAILGTQLKEHLEAMQQAGSSLGIRWLEAAVDPENPVSKMPWMPKARYKIMRRYLGQRGRLAHRMMTQTTSIQCAFDFESAEDWARKFRAGALLAPITVALFANSSRVDGAESGYRSFRQAIWRETDPDRCGLPEIVFDPGFDIEAWVEWACDVPAIFLQKARGLVDARGVPFRKLLSRVGCEGVSLEDWELQLSCIFTEVRSYSYIEVRSADMQPDRLIFSVPSFWTGILYHPDALAAALDLGASHSRYDVWREAMDQAAQLGLAGKAGGRSLRELATRALGLAAYGLRHGAATVSEPEEAAAPLAILARELGLDLEETQR